MSVDYREGYQIRDQFAIYFMTFTICGWIDLFCKKVYREIFMDSLRYCQKNKDLNVHAFVVMSNHIHLILSSEEGNLSARVRDIKGFTSKEFINRLTTVLEPRKDWILYQFEYYGSKNANNKKYQVWIQNNQFEELVTNKFTQQKLDYIHQNPVSAGIVFKPEEYVYSSASNYAGLGGLLDVKLLL